MVDQVKMDPKVSPVTEKFVVVGPLEVIVKEHGLYCFDLDFDIHIITQECNLEGLECFAIRHSGFTWDLELVRGEIVGYLRQKDAWVFGNLYEKLDIKSQEIYLRACSTVYKVIRLGRGY